MKILSRFPFNDKFTTISFQNAVVELKPFQIVVWVSISLDKPNSRVFPAFLDTGHNETFSISEQLLRDWAGVDFSRLRLLPGVRIGKQLLPRGAAILSVHRNVTGTQKLSSRKPFELAIPSGIIIQHPDNSTRLPILGMRGIVENRLRLIIDGKRKELSLSSIW